MTPRHKKGRSPEPLIVNPITHPRTAVCLRVAATFLELDERSVKARIDDGRLPAIRDGKVYRIAVAALLDYQRRTAIA